MHTKNLKFSLMYDIILLVRFLFLEGGTFTMFDNLKLEDLISEFIENILNIDSFITDSNYDNNFYFDAISNIAEFLKIGKITLICEHSQEHSNLLLHKDLIYYDGTNILYDSFQSCDTSQPITFSYSQNNDKYVINFFRMESAEVWNDTIISKLKLIANISFNIVGRIKLLEVSQVSKYHDFSTGVLNTNGITNTLNQLSNENLIQEYFCVHLNIRHFKMFNIQYSYSGGDKILKDFAEYMYNYLGDSQPFGRLGEDNFIAIVKKCNQEDFINNVKNIYLDYNGDSISINVYLGLYDINKEDSISTILNNSATAFNIARNTPNCHYIKFTEEMHKQALEVKHIEDVMHKALNDGEFITYYQPKIGLNNFELVGAEALVRWKRDNTLIPPYKFIPIFERNGFVTEIDFCMLKNVCKSIKNWISMGLEPITVSVNFSKLHLSNKNFVSKIKDIIKQYDISPKYIEIEFTETLDVENYNSLVNVNRELKKYGFKTSIDDFGAGFSSLNMLKDVPVDVVKLDKSLIDDTAYSTREKIIIQDIIKMAKTLDIEVIAEGVEDLEQLLFLKNIKCNQIQGYIFDKPLSLEDFERRLFDKNYYKNNPKFKNFVQDNYIHYNNIADMNFGKYTLDLDSYKIFDFNQGFCNIIGYTQDELLNNNYTIENFIICDEVNDYMNKVITNLKQNGEVCEEHKMIKKNGTKIYVMCLGMMKSINTAEFMISDISVNKTIERENNVLKSHFDFAQQELKNKNYMFEQIIKNLSGGIGIFALKEDDSIQTIFVSNSLCNILDCKRSDFDNYKEDAIKLICPADINGFLKDIHTCIDNQSNVLKRYVFNNGNTEKELTIKFKFANATHNGNPTIYIIIADYDVDNVEKELINEIAKISLLTEYSALDNVQIQLK